MSDLNPEVWHAVEGCVVDWEHHTQINPSTGEIFDFRGNKIVLQELPQALPEAEQE